QQSRGVVTIDLPLNGVRQIDTVNPPASLRRYLRWSIVEVFILGFQKAIVDLIQLIVEHLLRELVTMRRRVGRKQNPVLVLVEKLSRSKRLAAEFSDASRHVHVHVRKPVEVLGDILQVLREVAEVQGYKLR